MQKEITNSPERNFKFKDLRVYSSTEWLADNKKRYRQVYDRYETGYIYAELSFYNKQFDMADWDVNVQLFCYRVEESNKKICDLNFSRKVTKYDAVVFIREGWGSKAEGSFWKEGTYFWEAWIEGEKAGTKYFYIEDTEKDPSLDENAYVSLLNAKIYEGPHDDVNADDRVFMKTMSSEETRYVYAEVLLKNNHIHKPWHCELALKFFNGSKELKGHIVRLKEVEQGENEIKITLGWGSNVKGSWKMDHYTGEIVFMNKLLATIPFEVGEFFEEGTNGVILPGNVTTTLLDPAEIGDESTFDDVIKKLDALIGLGEIKQKVRDHAQYIKFLQLRKEKGFAEKDNINVHSVFSGNPGTGKTTVAAMMGKLYKKMGLLTKGHVHTVDRVDLVGEYIGQTAPKVKEAIEKARGGVLFIDEAYSLARAKDDNKDFGREVIEILVKEMSDGKNDFAVIVAGYPNEMKLFLDSNPGLKSRFKLYFDFRDYLPQELSQIAEFACKDKGVILTLGAKAHIDDMIVKAFRSRGRSFGNARFVFDLIEKAKIELGLRIMGMKEHKELDADYLSTIQLQDVEKIPMDEVYELPNIPIDEKLLNEAMKELNELIGMRAIKAQIEEMVKLVRYYRQTGKDVLNRFFLHTVFIGNPGTGKTTVARILTKIYKALGILERGHMVETDRQGLVAGYVGQTATKTAEKIEEAMGGVLFIDEAYALTENSTGRGGFGDEAIQTLLKRMEDKRGQFFVFVAGYPKNMEFFMKANPGLSSRFDKILKFEDYETADLLEIFIQMLSKERLYPSDDSKAYLKEYLEYVYKFRDQNFGNARLIRNAVREVVKGHNLRLAALNETDHDTVDKELITVEDMKVLKSDNSDFAFNRKSIGFK